MTDFLSAFEAIKRYEVDGRTALVIRDLTKAARVATGSGAHNASLRTHAIHLKGVRSKLVYLDDAADWLRHLPRPESYEARRVALFEYVERLRYVEQLQRAEVRVGEPDVEVEPGAVAEDIPEPEVEVVPEETAREETPQTPARSIPEIKSQGLTEITFAGSKLAACMGDDGKVYASIRRMCENLGLSFEGQRKKLIHADAEHWAVVTFTVTTGRDGKNYRQLLLEAPGIAFWMSSIKPSRLRSEDIKSLLREYQRRAAVVLAAHFTPEVAKRSTTDLALDSIKDSLAQLGALNLAIATSSASERAEINATLQAQALTQEEHREMILALQVKAAGGSPSERAKHSPNVKRLRFKYKKEFKAIVEQAASVCARESRASLGDTTQRYYGHMYRALEAEAADVGHYWSYDETVHALEAEAKATGKRKGSIVNHLRDHGPIRLAQIVACKTFPATAKALDITPAGPAPRFSVVDGGK